MTDGLQEASDILREARQLYRLEVSKANRERKGTGAHDAAVTAAGSPHASRMAAAHRATPSPTTTPTAPQLVPLTAAAGAAGINVGDVLPDPMAVARVMSDTLYGMDRDGPPVGPRVIAKARWGHLYPDERKLGQHDAFANSDKIDALCSPESLVASGGIALPVDAMFDVPTWASAARPFKDSLPSYQADRGGIRFMSVPDVGTVSLQGSPSGLGSATGIWTESTDASPAGQTKPVYTIAMPSENLTYVAAIATRLGAGNMMGRFSPELLASSTEVAFAAAAREAELNLLNLAYDASKQIQIKQFLGATRDILASVDLTIAGYRYSHRIPASVTFDVVFPEWAKSVVRADMARELAHDDSNAERDSMAISDEVIEGWFRTRGIHCVWTLDGVKSGTYGTGSLPVTNQFFPLATAGAEPQWPGESADGSFQLVWLLYPQGTLQFLDGGRLDLGVVRDSTLDAVNDFEIMTEAFEGLAMRGLEVYQCQSTIIPNGASSAGISGTYHE